MEKRISYFRQRGDSYIFAAGLGLLLSLAMVAWIVAVILVKGLGFFWPRDVVMLTLENGEKYLGEIWEEEMTQTLDAAGKPVTLDRIQLKIGNRDLYGIDFKWFNQSDIRKKHFPPDAVVFERREYGNFYGFVQKVSTDRQVWDGRSGDLLGRAHQAHAAALSVHHEVNALQDEITRLTEPLTRLQREANVFQYTPAAGTPAGVEKLAQMRRQIAEMQQQIAPAYQSLSERLGQEMEREASFFIMVQTAEGREKQLQLAELVRFYRPNAMGLWEKTGHYAGKLWEFVSAEPRESNTEGGVFPAIFGTVMMVLLMSIAVVPFGVLAAIYLNEYARQGPVVRFIRLSVNNLAGVPSIVFGVFGLGFFIYFVGGSIDQLFFRHKLPEPTYGTGGILWASLTLALLTLPVVVVATEEGLLAVPRANKEGALALGATRWQMIRRVALPNALPGILTGLILAISRGAGEVAPLMITGVVKLAPTLPLDASFPFLHLDRKFMHLGFHIYDVGFQSPNVEAAKPMVYTTALLLIFIVIVLNLLAIYIRSRLRKKYKAATF